MKPDFDRPSLPGKFFGEALVLIAREGRKAHPFMPLPEPCLTCALRPGTMPNLSPGTLIQLLNCVVGIEPSEFYCHHGMKEGEPEKVCAGYVAARLAPWQFTQETLTACYEQLKKLDAANGDAVRADFDAWYAEADPEGKMDAYQLARAYAGRGR